MLKRLNRKLNHFLVDHEHILLSKHINFGGFERVRHNPGDENLFKECPF